jgi:hypothetical protein
MGNRKRRYRRASRLVLHPPPHHLLPSPVPRPGPTYVRLPSIEKTKPRPFEEALEPLRWRMQREAGQRDQPEMPRRWR